MAGTALLTSLGLGGAWYVLVAGVPQLDPPRAAKNTGLVFQVEHFPSAAMGQERNYGLVLPPGYHQHPDRRYPVIVLLHGGHGNERDYEDKAKLTSVLHALYLAKKLLPSIVVTPDGNDQRGSSAFWDSDYYDGEHGNVASLIGQELAQVIRSRYRTLNQPKFWAIGGLSSGAWGAFNIGLRYPHTFHILFSHTGYFTDSSGPANSPQVFVRGLPQEVRQQLRVYLDAGEADHKYLEATRTFAQTLTNLGVMHQLRVYPGGHGIIGADSGWNYWHKHLANSLSFVGQQFRQGQPYPSSIPSRRRSSAPSHSKPHVTPYAIPSTHH